MIIESIVCNLHDLTPSARAELEARHIERINLDGAGLTKRIQRLETDHGRELGLRLPGGSADLRDGDVLLEDGDDVVIVSVLPADVLVIRPENIEQALFAAHSLGNRHLPAQFFGTDSEYGAEVMVVQHDRTVVAFLEEQEIPHSRQDRVMPVPFRHAEHTH